MHFSELPCLLCNIYVFYVHLVEIFFYMLRKKRLHRYGVQSCPSFLCFLNKSCVVRFLYLYGMSYLCPVKFISNCLLKNMYFSFLRGHNWYWSSCTYICIANFIALKCIADENASSVWIWDYLVRLFCDFKNIGHISISLEVKRYVC